jgi:hypothetical protein
MKPWMQNYLTQFVFTMKTFIVKVVSNTFFLHPFRITQYNADAHNTHAHNFFAFCLCDYLDTSK